MAVSDTMKEHYADHVAHQQDVWEDALAAEGFDSAVIHAGSQIVSFLDDYHYPFRPNPLFLQWVPLTHHDESVIIVRPGEKPILYYYQPVDYWHLPPSDPDPWWADYFDIRFEREPNGYRAGVPLGREAYFGNAPDIIGESDLNPMHVLNQVHLARTRKTAYEIDCITESARIAARCHVAAEQAFKEGKSEYDIHQSYLSAGQMTDPELPYGNIVALNDHGAVLHYEQQDRQAPDEIYSFLIDAGATFHAYCSDITRTYTNREGEFADMIAAMDEMQLGLCADMKAGVDYRDMHLRTHQEIAEILARHDIIRVSAEEAVESGLSSVFFPHGLGHYMGLQTHDVAGTIEDADGHEIPRPRGHPFLRLTRTLEAGNVLTVEPGLYFIDLLLKKWAETGHASVNWDKVEALKPYGGIRIEDDVLVTDSEPVNLTRDAFSSL